MISRADRDASLLDGLTAAQQVHLSEVLDDYFQALERGETPDRKQLAAQHPELASALADYLTSLDYLQNAAAGFVPAASVFGDTGPSDDSRADDSQANEAGPKQLGDFRILRERGRGGMGIVYEAQQISLDRRVALKVLPFAALLDAKQVMRFRNEAHAAGQLHHPHIVPVFAVGVDRGVHYYAMQLIEGPPLDRLIRALRNTESTARSQPDSDARPPELSPAPETSLAESAVLTAAEQTELRRAVERFRGDPPARSRHVAALGVQAATALQAAHEVGTVHRDVKPSNLMLDAQGDVWVTDFGLARCRRDHDLTRTGDLLGTMRYMSPEQLEAGQAILDHRTDIYSLGVTLYELLTLRPAVRGETPAAIIQQLTRGNPYRPRLFAPGIPVELENILLKATARDRDDRYATAQQFADDLQRFLAGQPTRAQRPSLRHRLGRFLTHHLRSVVTTACLLLVACCGLLTATMLLARQKQKTTEALQAAENSFRDYRRQLAASKHHLALLHRQNGEPAQAIAAVREAIRLQQAILREQPGDAETQRDLAAALTNQSFLTAESDPDQAAQLCREALQVQSGLLKDHPTNVDYLSSRALTASALAGLHRKIGRLERAEFWYRQALQSFQRAGVAEGDGAPRLRDLAVAMNNLGLTLYELHRDAEAERTFARAVTALQPAADRRTAKAGTLSTLGGIFSNLGRLQEKRGDRDAARRSHSRAVRYQQQAVRRAPRVERFQRLLKQHEQTLRRLSGRRLHDPSLHRNKSVRSTLPVKSRHSSGKRRAKGEIV